MGKINQAKEILGKLKNESPKFFKNQKFELQKYFYDAVISQKCTQHMYTHTIHRYL